MARDDGRRREKPETLAELFDQHRIELHTIPIPGRQHGGARSKIYCPDCQGGKEHERNFFVAIDRDGYGATWHCFRANNCGFSGGGRLKGAPERPQQAPKHYRKPTPEPRPERPNKLLEYFRGFGIQPETVEVLGIYRTVRHMPVIDRDGHQVKDRSEPRPVLAYPYYDDGELVNVKYKAAYPGGLKRFQQEAGTRRSLFNIDSFVNFGPDDFGIFVEGEDDVAACYQAGWHQTTTLPDGSPTKLKDNFDRHNDDDQRYVALYGEPRIDKIKVWVLAGDMDEAGIRHMEEIARRLGKGRCRLARWPADCKDAKETLQKRGIDAVNHVIQTAAWYPLEGVAVVTEEDMANFHAGIQEVRITSGMHVMDERFCLADGGQLIVTTGISGRGKTTFWNGMSLMYVMENARLMQRDHLVRPFHTVICSAEMNVRLLMSRLAAANANLPFHPHPVIERLSLDSLLNEHYPWIQRHYTFIRWPDRSTQPPISWAFERFEENILRTGAKLAILDPWQEFDDEMPDNQRNHSRWVGRQIQKFIGLAERTRCNFVLVAHPTKLKLDKDGKAQIPDGNDIADSAHFFSRCDIGLTVHRPNDQTEEMMVRVWKQRDSRFSRYGDTKIRYDPLTNRLWPRPMGVEDNATHANRSWHEVDDNPAYHDV